MNDRTLLKISLACSVVGIFIVLIFADKLEPPLMDITNISNSLVDQDVKIRGTVSSSRMASSAIMLEVQDETGKIKVVVFDTDLNVDKGQMVEILGKVQEYKGILELESEKIIFI